MVTYSRKIFYYETDRMSIVHNSNYLRIFEEARLEHLAKSGVDYHELEAEGILIPQNEAYVKYITPLQYGDTIKVNVELVSFNGIVMKYEYSLYRSNEVKPSASGYTSHCFLDEAKRLPVNLRKRLPEIYTLINSGCISQGM